MGRCPVCQSENVDRVRLGTGFCLVHIDGEYFRASYDEYRTYCRGCGFTIRDDKFDGLKVKLERRDE